MCSLSLRVKVSGLNLARGALTPLTVQEYLTPSERRRARRPFLTAYISLCCDNVHIILAMSYNHDARPPPLSIGIDYHLKSTCIFSSV